MRKKKVFYNVMSSTILQVIMLFTNLIVPHLLINHYGSSINGLITSITQFLSYITLLESGAGSVVIAKYYSTLANSDYQKMSQIFKEARIFFNAIAYFGIVYVIVLCVIFPHFVKDNIPTSTVITLILIISATIFAQYLFGLTNQCLIQADQKTYIINLTKSVASFISTALIAVLIYLNANIITVKGTSAIILISIPVYFSIYVRKNYKINYKIKRNRNILKDKWNGLGQHIAAFACGNTDIILLTLFSGVLEVSVYSAYALITMAMNSIQYALSNGVSATFGNMLAKKENDKLKKYYISFDYLNMVLFFILFTVAFFLILPFVKLYTKEATDINYIRPLYAKIMLASGCLCCLKCSYSCIIYAAGHFRQTMKSSYIEAGINIVISLLLVNKYGLVGVGIGTLAAMAYRCIDYIYYLSKNILYWDIKKIVYKYFINIIAFAIIYFAVKNLNFNQISNAKQWVIYAIITTLITAVIYISINLILNKKEVFTIYDIYIHPLIQKLTKHKLRSNI